MMKKNDSINSPDDVKDLISKYTKIEKSFMNEMKNFKSNEASDISEDFFPLTKYAIKFFEISHLDLKTKQLLFSNFISVFHFIGCLYQHSITNFEIKFTNQWKIFSNIFKNYRCVLLLFDYQPYIQEINNILSSLSGKSSNDQEINQITKKYNSFQKLLHKIQTANITSDDINEIKSKLVKLKTALISFFNSPSLQNHLDSLEYMLTVGEIVIQIYRFIDLVNGKLEKNKLIYIKIPTEAKGHRLCLKLYLKALFIEHSILQVHGYINQPNLIELLLRFYGLFYTYRFCSLSSIWNEYDLLIEQEALGLDINLENSIFLELKKVIGVEKTNLRGISIYKEFKNIYKSIFLTFQRHESPQSMVYTFSSLITLLLKLCNEFKNNSISNCAYKLCDFLSIHLILSNLKENTEFVKCIIQYLNESYYQSSIESINYLHSLHDATHFISKKIKNSIQIKPPNVMNIYQLYLDLLYLLSLNLNEIPKNVLKMHIDPKEILVYFSSYFNICFNQLKQQAELIQPISKIYYIEKHLLGIETLKQIFPELITEYNKIDIRPVIKQYFFILQYYNQIDSFLNLAGLPSYRNFPTISIGENNNIQRLLSCLIKIYKYCDFFTDDERGIFLKELVQIFANTFLKEEKQSIENNLKNLYELLPIPQCPEIILNCYRIIEKYGEDKTAQPKIVEFVTFIKSIFHCSFLGKFSDFQEKIKEKESTVDFIQKKYKYLKDSCFFFNEYTNICQLLHQIDENLVNIEILKFQGNYVEIFSYYNHGLLLNNTLENGNRLNLLPQEFILFEEKLNKALELKTLINIQNIDFLKQIFVEYGELNFQVIIESLLKHFDKWKTFIHNFESLSFLDKIPHNKIYKIRQLISGCADDMQILRISRASEILNEIIKELSPGIDESPIIRRAFNYVSERINCLYDMFLLKNRFSDILNLNNDELRSKNRNLNNYLNLLGEIEKGITQLSYLNLDSVKVAKKQCEKMIQNDIFCDIMSKSLEDLNSMKIAELKSIKRHLTRKFDLISCVKKPIYLSLNEKFEKCMEIIRHQSEDKNNIIYQLQNEIKESEEKIKNFKQNQIYKNISTIIPDITSALDYILSKEFETNNNSLIKKNKKNKNETSKKVDEKLNSNDEVFQLLCKIRDSSILNYKLKMSIDRLKFPSYGKTLSPGILSSSCGISVESAFGTSWLAKNVNDNSNIRNELTNLQKERDKLIEQIVEAKSKCNHPTPQKIHQLYDELIHSNVSNSANRVSKPTFLSYIKKSDAFFTVVEGDIERMSKKIKAKQTPHFIPPFEYLAKFTNKLNL